MLSPTLPGQWTPREMMRVRQVGDVQVSPDGRRVLYTVTTAVEATASGPSAAAYQTHIHLAEADGSPSRQLTFGPVPAIRPQWSPDGAWAAFVSSRHGSSNLHLLPLAGGEAVRATAAVNGVGNFKWSPDGGHIAFAARDGERELDPHVIGAGLAMSHLWVVAVDPTGGMPSEPRRLTQGGFNVDPVFSESFNWSPDGRTIAFTHTSSPQQGNLWPVGGDISTVDVASGVVEPLVTTAATSFGPVYSPDGDWLAYAHIERPTWPGIGDLWVIPAAGGEARRLHPTFDRKPVPLGWSATGDRIYYMDTVRTLARVGALPVDGGEPIDLGPQDRVLSHAHLNHARTHIGCVCEDLGSPPKPSSSSRGLRRRPRRSAPPTPVCRIIPWGARS